LRNGNRPPLIECLSSQAQRLVAEEPNRIRTYTIEVDIIEKLKRIYYFAERMAKTVDSEESVEEA